MRVCLPYRSGRPRRRDDRDSRRPGERGLIVTCADGKLTTTFGGPRHDMIEDFITSSISERCRLRVELPAVLETWNRQGIDAEIRDGANELDHAYPVVDNEIGRLSPSTKHPYEDLGRLSTYEWLEVD